MNQDYRTEMLDLFSDKRFGVLHHFVMKHEQDHPASDVFNNLDLSRPYVYSLIRGLVQEGFLVETRTSGGAQLYQLSSTRKAQAAKAAIDAFYKALDEEGASR